MRYFFGLTWRETERLVCAVVSAQRVVFVCPKFEDTALLAALPAQRAPLPARMGRVVHPVDHHLKQRAGVRRGAAGVC